jgi:hypothetical protein
VVEASSSSSKATRLGSDVPTVLCSQVCTAAFSLNRPGGSWCAGDSPSLSRVITSAAVAGTFWVDATSVERRFAGEGLIFVGVSDRRTFEFWAVRSLDEGGVASLLMESARSWPGVQLRGTNVEGSDATRPGLAVSREPLETRRLF